MRYCLKTVQLYIGWLLLICLDAAIRILLICCIPLILIWSAYGMGWSQKSAQASFDLSGLLIRRWPKPPPTDWLLFWGLRRRKPAENRIVTGEVLPPLD